MNRTILKNTKREVVRMPTKRELYEENEALREIIDDVKTRLSDLESDDENDSENEDESEESENSEDED
jgi:hypothetical protein